MTTKRHPDDVPRELGPLSTYLREAYGLEVSAWSLADLARAKVLPASKVNGRWRSTATAYLEAMDPKHGRAAAR